MYQRALVITKKISRPESPSWATIENNIAELYRRQGRLDEAERLYRRVLAACEKSAEGETRSATAMNNLATLYTMQSRYEEAESLFRRSLQIQEKLLGPEHPR